MRKSSDSRTNARPYAKAIFEYGREQQALEFTSQALILLSRIAQDSNLESVYHDPSYSPDELAQVFVSVMKAAHLHKPEIENFIQLLAHYKRLSLLPLIQVLFEETKAQYEKSSQVSVVSAMPLSSSLQSQVKTLLEKRFGSEVSLVFSEDKRLMGGMLISSGDWVMDCSVKNQLEKLKSELLN